MQLISQLLDSTKSSFDPLNFIGILITVIASIYIFKGETTLSFIRERHDNLIFPLFNTLEPFLYQEPQQDIFEKVVHIVESNKNLSDGKMLELIYNCSEKLSKDNFFKLCSYIDKTYDSSCRKLGLKTRSVAYRINRRQYKSICYLIWHATLYSVAAFFVAIAILFSLFLIFVFVGIIFESATLENQILILIVCLLLFIALSKYMEKHL